MPCRALGGPVASFIAYNEAKRIVKNPDVPFGEGAVEGIMASESSNNACIGGALIPMLTLAVPGDAVRLLFFPCSMYTDCSRVRCLSARIRKRFTPFWWPVSLPALRCSFWDFGGTAYQPCDHYSENIMIPVVTSLCVIGSFPCNNRLFDVALMFLFG